VGCYTARLLELRVRIPPRAWMFVCFECCVFVRSLRRADHSSRGVLPTVLCHYVWSRNLKTEKAKTRKWVVKGGKIILLIIIFFILCYFHMRAVYPTYLTSCVVYLTGISLPQRLVIRGDNISVAIVSWMFCVKHGRLAGIRILTWWYQPSLGNVQSSSDMARVLRLMPWLYIYYNPLCKH
jgi:hypothetical protein